MKQPKRLTRAEKMAAVRAVKHGEPIPDDPRLLRFLDKKGVAQPDDMPYNYGIDKGDDDHGTDIRGVGTGREA
jgi:hypothetical protein